jgi:Protein of unknown function (DUF3788)
LGKGGDVNEHARMLDGAKPPEPAQVAEWIGPRASGHWAELTEFIESRYPGVFDRSWWFGGKKWGWSLRFKKSKSFCNLIPERGQFKALLVFGAEEREKVEAVLPQLTSHVRADYAKATTFHDGKWVAAVVDSRKVVADIERLLVLKRKPKDEGPSDAKARRGKRGAA